MAKNRIAQFEKISLEQFLKDSGTASDYNNIQLPRRATKGSAGYDLILPFDIKLNPGESVKVLTGIRVKMEDSWVCIIAPKSGLGSKYRFQLDNTLGVIDADYYYADNEGHIMVFMRNNSKDGKVLELKAGKAFAQAIFIPFGITVDDDTEGIRTGGYGSTGV